jgi:thiamine-monophosphate kinase
MSSNNEFDLIDKFFVPLTAQAPGARGLLDDAAIISPSADNELVVTMDTIVAGVHYLANETPDNIVAKLMGSNLSDLAAMGAKPLGFTLSCGWASDVEIDEIKAFAKAMHEWVNDYTFPLLGGDTVKTPDTSVFSLTAFGEAPHGKSISRSGAQVGDDVFVSGTIGDGGLGLLAAQGDLPQLSSAHQAFLSNRYRIPQPRISLGCSLSGIATACIDISDGLIQDTGHIARTSGVRIELEWNKIPLSEASIAVLESNPEMMSTILTGGDDYELLFTGRDLANRSNLDFTKIGKVVEGSPEVNVLDTHGKLMEITKTGYNHFS